MNYSQENINSLYFLTITAYSIIADSSISSHLIRYIFSSLILIHEWSMIPITVSDNQNLRIFSIYLTQRHLVYFRNTLFPHKKTNQTLPFHDWWMTIPTVDTRVCQIVHFIIIISCSRCATAIEIQLQWFSLFRKLPMQQSSGNTIHIFILSALLASKSCTPSTSEFQFSLAVRFLSFLYPSTIPLMFSRTRRWVGNLFANSFILDFIKHVGRTRSILWYIRG